MAFLKLTAMATANNSMEFCLLFATTDITNCFLHYFPPLLVDFGGQATMNQFPRKKCVLCGASGASRVSSMQACLHPD
jgi:hypothetical protein